MTRRRPGAMVMIAAFLTAAPLSVCRADDDDDGFGSEAKRDVKTLPTPKTEPTGVPPSSSVQPRDRADHAPIQPPPKTPPSLGESTGKEPPEDHAVPVAPEVRRSLEFPVKAENRDKAADLGIAPASLKYREAILAKLDSGDHSGLRAAIFEAARRFPDDPAFRAMSLIVDPHVEKAKLDRVLARLAAEGTRFSAGSGYSYEVTGGRDGERRRATADGVPRETLLEAGALSRSRKYDQVVALLTRELRARPDDAFLLDARTVARARMGDYKGAEEDSLAAVRLNAAGTDALRNRAWLMLAQGRFEESFRWAQKALELDPLDATALVTRAQYWYRTGRDDLALADYKSAARIDPANYELYHDALDRAGRKAAEGAGAQQREEGEKRAMERAAAGDYDAALRETASLLAADPSSARGHRVRSFVFFKTKRFGEAIKEANLALKANPRDPYALLTRGLALEALGSTARAEADYRLVDQIAPGLRKKG